MKFLDNTELEVQEVPTSDVNGGNKLLSVNQPKSEMKNYAAVFARLSHHANVLNPIFPSNVSKGKNFLVFEQFNCSLDDNFAPRDMKDLAIQVCNGLSHYHEVGIVFEELEADNIIQCTIGGNKKNPVHCYKIVNKGNAVIYANNTNESDLKIENIKSLGALLRMFQKNHSRSKQKRVSILKDCDRACLANLINDMVINKHTKMMPEFLLYPIFWSIQESLMFIVEIVKMFEPLKENGNFRDINSTLAKCEDRVFGKNDKNEKINWREYAREISKYMQEKTKIQPRKSIFGLLTTIRNLVSFNHNESRANISENFFQVCHNMDEEVVKIIGGEGQRGIFKYFLDRFPTLITVLYENERELTHQIEQYQS